MDAPAADHAATVMQVSAKERPLRHVVTHMIVGGRDQRDDALDELGVCGCIRVGWVDIELPHFGWQELPLSP